METPPHGTFTRWTRRRTGARAPLGSPEHKGLVLLQQVRIIDGTVMVHLPPNPVDSLEEPACPNLQFQFLSCCSQLSPFASHDVKENIAHMQGVVEELHDDGRRALEYFSVYRLNLSPATLDTTKGIIHLGLVGLQPILPHQLKIA